MILESQSEKNFYNKFTAELTERHISTVELIRCYAYQQNHSFDFLIKINNKEFAAVELKRWNFTLKNLIPNIIQKITYNNDIKYLIIGDGETFYINDIQTQKGIRIISFSDLINVIIKQLPTEKPINVESIFSIIQESIDEISEKYPSIKKNIKGIKTILNSEEFKNEIEYDKEINSYSFRHAFDLNSVENRIFRCLLKTSNTPKDIYRYVPLNTAFLSLINNNIRMYSIVGMNDPSETYYFDNYVFDKPHNYDLIDNKEIERFNNTFILSCTKRNDDLTQFRLYADDAKGVSLCFRINKKHENSIFTIMPINYGQKDNLHIELEFIKHLIFKIEKNKIPFKLKTISFWRHFFKPYEYNYEKEIRILYFKEKNLYSKDWLITTPSNILCPYIELKLSSEEFPLQLKKIVLGPRFIEKTVNRRQFEQLIEDLLKKGILNDRISIDVSAINNYR